MKVLLFGGSGMIGQGVLRECLSRDDVQVIAVGRTPGPQQHPRLTWLPVTDFLDFSAVAHAFEGVDAVLYCLGVSSAGLSEPEYRRVTFDFTLAAAKAIVARSPGATFCFVSGQGTDRTSRTMWARVKGETEHALSQLGFARVFHFRPGAIEPLDGITSKTGAYRVFMALLAPFWPLLRRLPRFVTSTRQLGFAMVEVARRGHATPVLESVDLNAVR